MHSLSTSTPTRRLLTGSNAARWPPYGSYLSLWILVITVIRPWAPTGLCANGLKLDSMAITDRMSVGSMPVRWPTVHDSWTRRATGSGAPGGRGPTHPGPLGPGAGGGGGPGRGRGVDGAGGRGFALGLGREVFAAAAGEVARLEPAPGASL